VNIPVNPVKSDTPIAAMQFTASSDTIPPVYVLKTAAKSAENPASACMFAARAFKDEEFSEYPTARIAVRAQEKKQIPHLGFHLKIMR
jgi:hypothetical protein